MMMMHISHTTPSPFRPLIISRIFWRTPHYVCTVINLMLLSWLLRLTGFGIMSTMKVVLLDSFGLAAYECTQICVSQFDYVLLVLFAYGESINANVQVSTINRVSNCAQHQIDDDDDDTHHHLHKSMRKSIYLSEYIYMYSEEGL